MARRVFDVELSQKGIEQLKKDLRNYRDNILQKRLELLVMRLAERGVTVAQANVTKLNAVFTGELLSSIKSRRGASGKMTAVFYIVADSDHAAFVEFGTGQLGMEGGYPYPLPPNVDWQYNTGNTIFEISPGQYGWFYPGDDGQWYFTQGMPSRPFMYETSLELMKQVVGIAREVFKT